MGGSSRACAQSAGNCIQSAHATYTSDGFIEAKYSYPVTRVTARKDAADGDSSEPTLNATVETRQLRFRTQQRVPRVGVMLVGLGGNNGTTIVAGILANKKKLTWRTKCGVQRANWYGSLVMSGTMRLGSDAETGEDVHVPLHSVLPMLSPDDIVVGGWDISGAPLGDAMRRAAVLDVQLQDQLYSEMQTIKPLPGVYYASFIADSQKERADNVLQGSMQEQLEALRRNIRAFKSAHDLEKVLVLWTATTERFCDVQENVHATAETLLHAVQSGDTAHDISPSTLYAMAAILEGCSFINGSPQNTLVPGVVELASRNGVFVGGDDFKSGQTKLKSVLVDFLVSAGIKPVSIVSYNHLGNNDGRNLDSYAQFRSKEISKSNVVDDMVKSNPVLYENGSKPDHCVVIKYVPYVGDSKRALDEYTSEIFLGGLNTISVHNTCEDSLLAAPIILDLILLTELCERIHIAVEHKGEAVPHYEKFHPVLSLLSYLCKAPLVPHGTPVVNALAAQRTCITNVLRACIGLPPESHMQLEYKVPRLLSERRVSAGL